MGYRVLQLTNNEIGAIAAPTVTIPFGQLIPLGRVTRKLCCGNAQQGTFSLTTTDVNTINLNDSGYYRVIVTASLAASAAGDVTIGLIQNDDLLISATETATAGDDVVNISLSYIVRVMPNCCASVNCPSTLQIANLGVALTGGSINISVEKAH